MDRDDASVTRRTIDLGVGVYVIRYATADDNIAHPSVNLAVDPDDPAAVSFILQRDAKAVVLWRPGAGVAARATRPGKLTVEIVPRNATGSVAATLKIEPLSQGSDAFVSLEADDRPGSRRHDGRGLQVLGHVAGRGDILAEADEWLGGPEAPARIEGIRLDWPLKPRGLEVGYSARFGRPNATSSKFAALGSFVGSRGRALPLVGLTLALSGPEAADYQFAGEAIFLGAPVLRGIGERIVLSGPTGREPLVGLRLKIESRQALPFENARQTAQKIETRSQAPGRVRVFHSRNRALSA